MVSPYAGVVPKLWNETIDAHRRAVHDAILSAAARLAFEHGLTSVTMSQIATEVGIGRATLYKYFPDVETILLAWHESQISNHLRQLAEARDRAEGPIGRLEAVLLAYALIAHERHDIELASLLHRGEHLARAQAHLLDFVRDLVAEGAMAGEVRDDVPPVELARFCLHALTAAGSMPVEGKGEGHSHGHDDGHSAVGRDADAVGRLVQVTMSGLRPEH